jgi:hypothetical protein
MTLVIAPEPALPDGRDRGAGLLAVSGPLTFVRFAAPPNVLGYCGTDDHDALVGHMRAGLDGPELIRLCRSFEGAWPYLELIATEAGIRDPLDPRVVEAYWIGGGLLDRVRPDVFAGHLDSRFRARTTRPEWSWLAGKPALGGVPHHSFHVLEVMPRIGMLREGQVAAILPAMGQCLVRPARVVGRDRDRTVVSSRPLIMAGGKLDLGDPIRTNVQPSVMREAPGDLVAVHWGWSCGPLSARQARTLDVTLRAAIARANLTT